MEGNPDDSCKKCIQKKCLELLEFQRRKKKKKQLFLERRKVFRNSPSCPPSCRQKEKEEEALTTSDGRQRRRWCKEEGTTTTTTTTCNNNKPLSSTIPALPTPRNRALDEAIAEHAEQLLKRERDALRHANRAYLIKQHQKDVGKALERLETHLREYSIVNDTREWTFGKRAGGKVRIERERKKRELAIKEEKELQIHLKKRITRERFAVEQLKEEHERQTRNANVWEKRREVVNVFEHRAVERDHFMEKQEREHEKRLGELSKKLRVTMEDFESADVERLAEIASRKGLTGIRAKRWTREERWSIVYAMPS